MIKHYPSLSCWLNVGNIFIHRKDSMPVFTLHIYPSNNENKPDRPAALETNIGTNGVHSMKQVMSVSSW